MDWHHKPTYPDVSETAPDGRLCSRGRRIEDTCNAKIPQLHDALSWVWAHHVDETTLVEDPYINSNSLSIN